MSGSIRYSRQVTLPGWGKAGQDRLGASSVLIIGMGGLGVPAATYLAAAGAGSLVINDFDTVDASNLARQPIFDDADIGKLKVTAAAKALEQQNPDCRLTTMDRRLDAAQLVDAIAASDVTLDCSDNFPTRFAVNAACVQTATPLVSGAAIRFEAQLAVFRADLAPGPCYRCLYDESGVELEDCQGQGVISPMVGLIGSAMALEAVRIIVGIGKPLHSRVLVYDAATSEWRAIGLRQDPRCPICSDSKQK